MVLAGRAVLVRAGPGCGPAGWLPQPDRRIAAPATAGSRRESRNGPRQVVMLLRRSPGSAGCLLGGHGEHPAQIIRPGGVAGNPDRVVPGPAPQPAQDAAGRAVDHDPRVVAGTVLYLHRLRRRADRPGRLARGDRDL